MSNDKMKKITGALLSSLAACAALTGCSAFHRAVEPQKTSVSAEPSEIEFSWWGNDERHLYTMEGVDLFQAAHPEISVNYHYGVWSGFEKRNRVWLESCKEADVMQINYAWLTEFSPDGNGYYDLYELADEIDLGNFTPEDLAFGEKNGKLNAIPIAFNTSTMFFNEKIYSQYGLKLPVTWDDYFTAAKVMKKDGMYPLGMVKKQLYLLLLAYYEQSTGEHAFGENGELLLEAKDIEFMLDFYKRLIDEKVLIPIDQFSTGKFTKGEIAGAMFWISDADKYCGALEANGGTPVIGEYPSMEGMTLPGWYMKPATMYAISAVTEHPDAAAKLLDYLVNDKEMAALQKNEKGVPVSKSALEELESEQLLQGYGYEANRKMLAERDRMEIMIPAMENEGIVDALKQGADEYLYNRVSKKECAETILKEMREILAKTS